MEKFKLFLTKKSVLFFSIASSLVLTLILVKIDNMTAGPSGMGVSYLQLSFTKESFLRIISLWGDYGVDLFLKTIWIDYFYTVTYSLLIAGGMIIAEFKLLEYGKTFSRLGQKLFILPFIAAVFDMIENSIHIYILVNRFYNDYIILAASITASIKWFLIIISLLIFLKRYFGFRKIMKAQA